MEAQPPFDQIPKRPDGTIALWMSAFVPTEAGEVEYTTVGYIEPPLTHERLQLAARRMANAIMVNVIGTPPDGPMSPAPDTINGNGGDAA